MNSSRSAATWAFLSTFPNCWMALLWNSCSTCELSNTIAAWDVLYGMLRWSAAVPPFPHSIVRQPVRATQLVDLPYDFSEVIHLASAFRYAFGFFGYSMEFNIPFQMPFHPTWWECGQRSNHVSGLRPDSLFSELLLSETGEICTELEICEHLWSRLHTTLTSFVLGWK